jgi:hypothetical protein
MLVRVLSLLASHKNWTLERGIDGAKQSLCSGFFGDNVEHRSARRTNFRETYPTPEA